MTTRSTLPVLPTVATLLFLLALFVVGAQTSAEPHEPIVIVGDDALCRPGSGVVNCGDADGTPERPYLIQGWRIEAWQIVDGTCGPYDIVGIHLCDVTASVIIRDVDIRVWPNVPMDLTGLTGPAPPAGITLHGTSDVRMHDVYIDTAGLGLVIDGADGSTVTIRESAIKAAQAGSPLVELVRSRDARLTMEDTVLDASGRNFGVQGVHVEDGSFMLLRGIELTGPSVQGIQVRGGTLIVQGATITMNVSASPADEAPFDGIEAAAISVLDGAELTLEDSEVQFAGVGVSLNGAASLQMRANLLYGSSSLDVAIQIAGDGTDPAFACAFIADFNEIGDLLVRNGLEGCSLVAPDNWWGGGAPQQGQVQGAVLTPSWSPVRLDDMARVTLEHQPPTRLGTSVWLEGVAEGPVERLRLSGSVVAEMKTSPGPFAWDVPLTDTSAREVTLRLQACGAQFCGPPLDWTATRSAVTAQPVAVATVMPSVAPVGQDVVIDASASFSRLAVPIVAYKFDDLPWQSEPTYVTQWHAPGTYVVSVQVEDHDGIRSEPKDVTVRVRAPLSTDEVASRDAPASVLWVLLLLPFARRRRP